MTDHIENRFAELDRIAIPRSDEASVVRRGKVVRRVHRLKVVGAVCVAVLATGFVATRFDLSPPRTLAPVEQPSYRDEANGFSAELPEDWFGFSPESGGDPAEIATFASFPVEDDDYGTVCGPGFEGMRFVPVNEAVISISERYYSPETGGRIEREFAPRPDDIGPDDGDLFPYGKPFYREGCPDTENEWWQTEFRDKGRGFYVTLQFGSAMTTDEREEAWEILDSLRFEEREGFPEDSDYERYEDQAAAFSVVYPKVWHRAEASLTPSLADPVELFSIASFPLRYRQTDCANMPKSAFEDMGSQDVFVSIQEASGAERNDGFFEKRSESLRTSKEWRLECVPEGLTSYWIPFRDHDRVFYALAIFGADASLGWIDEAWGVLDSFEPQP